MLKQLVVGLFALAAAPALASPIAGEWQGPCEVRGQRSVMFNYVFSAADAAGNGSLAKTKIYYDDAACSVYNHTGRMTVAYKIGAETAEGYYELDVNHRGTMFYDIAGLSDDGLTLSFGEQDSRDPAARPTTLSTTDRVFVKVVP